MPEGTILRIKNGIAEIRTDGNVIYCVRKSSFHSPWECGALEQHSHGKLLEGDEVTFDLDSRRFPCKIKVKRLFELEVASRFRRNYRIRKGQAVRLSPTLRTPPEILAQEFPREREPTREEYENVQGALYQSFSFIRDLLSFKDLGALLEATFDRLHASPAKKVFEDISLVIDHWLRNLPRVLIIDEWHLKFGRDAHVTRDRLVMSPRSALENPARMAFTLIHESSHAA